MVVVGGRSGRSLFFVVAYCITQITEDGVGGVSWEHFRCSAADEQCDNHRREDPQYWLKRHESCLASIRHSVHACWITSRSLQNFSNGAPHPLQVLMDKENQLVLCLSCFCFLFAFKPTLRIQIREDTDFLASMD
ncbi:uncharacterized protein LOC118479854 [Helianthus annuus]|uniref:uncharacterized protein LOC118479854 n=1 Tax=Helianthus annuus TaxID=4232 RepID=UPI001652D8A0|nr:uncharacterized protein LOC118479854 [Helianthus annuus]